MPGKSRQLGAHRQAVLPPIPVSTSSKTNVGTSSLAASTDFNASISRLASPPEGDFGQGPEILPRVGGKEKLHLVCTPAGYLHPDFTIPMGIGIPSGLGVWLTWIWKRALAKFRSGSSLST